MFHEPQSNHIRLSRHPSLRLCEPATRHEDGYAGIRCRVEAGRSESDAVHHAVRPGQTWPDTPKHFRRHPGDGWDNTDPKLTASSKE